MNEKAISRRLPRLLIVVFLLIIGVLLGAATVAVAQGDGVIHACVALPGSNAQSKNVNGEANTGSVRIVSSPDDCRNGEAPISWNVEGAPGPAGEQGPQGVVGPQGEQGPPGDLSLAGQSCPDGEALTGFDSDGHIVCSDE
jgi:hypothetical protein